MKKSKLVDCDQNDERRAAESSAQHLPRRHVANGACFNNASSDLSVNIDQERALSTATGQQCCTQYTTCDVC